MRSKIIKTADKTERKTAQICGFECEILCKTIKNQHLRVKNGIIYVSVPRFLAFKATQKFIEINRDWIEKRLEIWQKEREFELNFIQILGKKYAINRNFCKQNEPERINFDGNSFQIFLDQQEQEQIKIRENKLIFTWQKEFLNKIINEFIAKFNAIIDRKINAIRIHKAQTRWGSCNHKKGYLNFNIALIKKRYALIEYVVLHEMTHLFYPDHGVKFYEFLRAQMPNFRELEKEINQKG